jgi:DNA-binding SARP family transcriptional activator
MPAQRLLALLALEERSMGRTAAAATLWMNLPESRARANLRSAIWRTRQAAPQLIETSPAQVRLAPEVVTDLAELRELTGSVLRTDGPDDGHIAGAERLTLELLPGWYDEWVILERERLAIRQLHTLERIAWRHVQWGRHAAAIDTALTAVGADPLRESAQRCLVEAYLGEGNVVAAIRQFRRFEKDLAVTFGVAPTAEFRQRMRAATGL